MLNQTPNTLRTEIGPKVSGLLAIQAHVLALPLFALVLFSSVSSIVAPLGQSNYATANAMLNSIANFHSLKV